MSKSLQDYRRIAEIAKRAKLYTGSTKKISKGQKSHLTKLSKLPNFFSNKLLSVEIPKAYAQEYARRGFTTLGNRVIVNGVGGNRISWNLRNKEIRTVKLNSELRSKTIRRYSLDLDLDRAIDRSESEDSMLQMTRGSDKSLTNIINRDSAEIYLQMLAAKNDSLDPPSLLFIQKIPINETPLFKSTRVKNWSILGRDYETSIANSERLSNRKPQSKKRKKAKK